MKLKNTIESHTKNNDSKQEYHDQFESKIKSQYQNFLKETNQKNQKLKHLAMKNL